MVRLVQGDVGCGKTVVAGAAAARAVGSGLQAALMAPTELLAEQHCAELRRLVSHARHSGRARDRLTAGTDTSQRARSRWPAARSSSSSARTRCSRNRCEFARLGLVIVDEQHRFGVHQRLALRDKGARDGRLPHQLIMTATPIPRTLAMTAYADLDVSVIDELPPGRTPVKTVVLPATRRDEIVAAHPQGRARGPAGVLGLSADRRVRGAALPGRGGNRGSSSRKRCPRCASGSCTAACRRRKRNAA